MHWVGAGVIVVSKPLVRPCSQLSWDLCMFGAPGRVSSESGQGEWGKRPTAIITVSTLYALQGATAEPGTIYYFCTSRRLSSVVVWIVGCMVLPRACCLSEFRSAGLTSIIRELIYLGPSQGF